MMLDSLSNLKKINTSGKLGVVIIEQKSQLENLEIKYNYFSQNSIDVLVLTKIIPTDEIYQNCNLLIFEPSKNKDPKEIIFEFAKEKNYTRILLWEDFIKNVFIYDKDFEGFLEQLIIQSKDKEKFNYSFIDGAFLEVKFNHTRLYRVEFWDKTKDSIVYSVDLWSNNWSKTIIQYFVDYHIKVLDKFTGELLWSYEMSLENKNCLISFESSSLGDTIAWMSQIENFIEKHKCQLYLSTFHNSLFQDVYPQIKFINPGDVVYNLYSSYRIGWFYKENGEIDYNLNPTDFRKNPLHKTCSDILGIDFVDKKPRIKISNTSRNISGDYVTIGFHSTSKAKYWNNPDGWQGVVDFFKQNDIDSVVISREGDGWMGNHFPTGVIDRSGDRPIEERITDIYNSKMFIGLGSGISWLAWAVGVPVVIISGFSDTYSEPQTSNIIRINNPEVCNSCFNRHRLDPGDWNWCPDNKGTPSEFICTKTITSHMVVSKIAEFLKIDKTYTKTDNFSLINFILKERKLKTYTLFVRDKKLWEKNLTGLENNPKNGVDIVVTDKIPELIYPIVKNLVNPKGVIFFVGSEFDEKFLEMIKEKKTLKYTDPKDEKSGYLMVFLD